jgi:hypothetical protein
MRRQGDESKRMWKCWGEVRRQGNAVKQKEVRLQERKDVVT